MSKLLAIISVLLFPFAVFGNVRVIVTNTMDESLRVEFFADAAKSNRLTFQICDILGHERVILNLPEQVWLTTYVTGVEVPEYLNYWGGLDDGMMFGIDWDPAKNGWDGGWDWRQLSTDVEIYSIGETQANIRYLMLGFSFVFAAGLFGLAARWVRIIMVGDTPE
jgi:hypothetical protein